MPRPPPILAINATLATTTMQHNKVARIFAPHMQKQMQAFHHHQREAETQIPNN
jgi:hypothetical protein